MSHRRRLWFREQPIYLMSDKPVERCDELWWEDEDHYVYFDQYVGITQDKPQCQYAQKRVSKMQRRYEGADHSIILSCADAAKPQHWAESLITGVTTAREKSQETPLLELDTAYHISPSRWILVQHTCQNLNALFMAFDLCLSPKTTVLQKLVLRILTALMGAPWANFVTPEVYHQKLLDFGYPVEAIRIVDVLEHVFAHWRLTWKNKTAD